MSDGCTPEEPEGTPAQSYIFLKSFAVFAQLLAQTPVSSRRL